jgi:hypothetical protein
MKKLSACSEVPFYALFSAKSRLFYFLDAPRPPPPFVFLKTASKKQFYLFTNTHFVFIKIV